MLFAGILFGLFLTFFVMAWVCGTLGILAAVLAVPAAIYRFFFVKNS